MKISTKGRYALRLMLDLAQNESGGYIPLKEVAERQNITVKYLEQIVTLLSRAGCIKGIRGNSGGYKLSKPAENYRIGDILRAAEGSLIPVACLAESPNQCPRNKDCLTLPFWQGLNKTINEYVDHFTLADLLNDKVQIQVRQS